MNQALHHGDKRLPAVRARLFLLVRSLWKSGMVRVPLTLQKGESRALQLLHPLWQRLRVELLGEQLLRDILPAIERHLISEGTLQRRESSLTPNGPVDWPATWRRQLGHPTDSPIITRRWTRTLDLPENHLAYYALKAVAHDCQAALSSVSDTPHTLTLAERAPLRRLRDQIVLRLQRPPWNTLFVKRKSALNLHSPLAMPNVSTFLAHRSSHLSAHPAYMALLAWWQQWQGWQQPAAGQHALLDPELEPKWLFELLLLFEVVAALAYHFPIRQTRALAQNSAQPAFIAETPTGPLALFYQTGKMFSNQRSLKDIWGIPDVVLRLPGSKPTYLILDAKNYGPSAHTQAIYKMLGYLYQFGYNASGKHHFDEVLAGVLVFPTNEREGYGLRNWQEAIPNAQAVMSFVLPPVPDKQFTGLQELIAWLIEQMKR